MAVALACVAAPTADRFARVSLQLRSSRNAVSEVEPGSADYVTMVSPVSAGGSRDSMPASRSLHQGEVEPLRPAPMGNQTAIEAVLEMTDRLRVEAHSRVRRYGRGGAHRLRHRPLGLNRRRHRVPHGSRCRRQGVKAQIDCAVRNGVKGPGASGNIGTSPFPTASARYGPSRSTWTSDVHLPPSGSAPLASREELVRREPRRRPRGWRWSRARPPRFPVRPRSEATLQPDCPDRHHHACDGDENPEVEVRVDPARGSPPPRPGRSR